MTYQKYGMILFISRGKRYAYYQKVDSLNDLYKLQKKYIKVVLATSKPLVLQTRYEKYINPNVITLIPDLHDFIRVINNRACTPLNNADQSKTFKQDL